MIPFRAREQINSSKVFRDGSFAWSFTAGDARGVRIGEKTKHVCAAERRIAETTSFRISGRVDSV